MKKPTQFLPNPPRNKFDAATNVDLQRTKNILLGIPTILFACFFVRKKNSFSALIGDISILGEIGELLEQHLPLYANILGMANNKREKAKQTCASVANNKGVGELTKNLGKILFRFFFH